MAAAVQLQIHDGSGNFAFDVEGAYYPRIEAVYKDAANPPELVALREVWEFRGCKLVSIDNTVVSTWQKTTALRARLQSRTAGPTYAQIVRDPAGAAAVLIKLGPTAYEQFKVEALEGEIDDLSPKATGRTVNVFTIRVSAVMKFTEAVTGIVGWDQVVDVSYPDGGQVLEWRTRVTTKEGTSAVTAAQTYAAISTTALDGTFLYETNGPYGIDYVYTDADEQNSRVPTICECVSRVRSFGIQVGGVLPGAAPNSISYSITTSVGVSLSSLLLETSTITKASARGPGALAFVMSKAPLGPIQESEVVDEKAGRAATGTWTQKTPGQSTETSTTQIQVKLSGGAKVFKFRPVCNELEPLLQVGAFVAWVATVDVAVERVGGTGATNECQVPGLLGDPWVFDQDASEEGEPVLQKKGADDTQDHYRRECRYVYRSPSPPAGQILAELKASTYVDSLFGVTSANS